MYDWEAVILYWVSVNYGLQRCENNFFHQNNSVENNCLGNDLKKIMTSWHQFAYTIVNLPGGEAIIEPLFSRKRGSIAPWGNLPDGRDQECVEGDDRYLRGWKAFISF